MGYDLHITRADHWADADRVPIPRGEWESFARERLAECGEVTYGETGAEPVFGFDCGTGDVVSLHWWRDRITVTGITDARSIAALRWIGEALAARLIGDDGEAY
ncbi:hypothetical protein [Saccharothrix obliqua]|uniref:hypothetical protein n=1 Tax=Saccharothrix obliqua TaxID=2861747 RepID=UPI001C5CCFEE|nr:hypothetical protein [Saccharothrix obliqua]MBW4721355.1 hypothetical protein [Saccharothrix obliqua]